MATFDSDAPAAARPKDADKMSAACEMAQAFDVVLSDALIRATDNTPRDALRFFIFTPSSCRLNRSAAAHYASWSIHAGALDDWFRASRLPRKKDLLIALCVNASTLSRTHPDKALEPGVTERLFRQSDLMVRAAEVFGDEGPTWMTKPHPRLEGKTPIEFATNEYGGEKVRAILNAIEYGGVV